MSSQAEVLSLCGKYGTLLAVPNGLDGPRVMAAIAWNESSCGEDVTPRHEPAYDVGGLYSTQPPQNELLAQWGSKAAYSYGPWQMLPCNARGFTPDELNTDDEKCALAFVGFFNRYIIGVRHAATLDEVLQSYNSGHFVAAPSSGVVRYVNEGTAKYYALGQVVAC